MAKDLELATENNLGFPLGTVTHRTFDKAKSESGEEDVMSVVKFIKQTQK